VSHRSIIVAGGASFIVGAAAFVAVFSYLAANFDYPGILDGSAADVLPRLRAGGPTMRATWALYAFLPLLLVPGAIGTFFACHESRGRMAVALVAASVGALAMCLGLMRWPSLHWVLSGAWETSSPEAREGIAAMFLGFNLYLGNYIGEFLGEICLGAFFLLSGLSLLHEARFPKWLGWGGSVFACLFLVGAFRNVVVAVQPIADINNSLLPVWMIVLGAALIRYSRPPAHIDIKA
jgi:hypothetical protein